MAKKLFVRGIDWKATQQEFYELFAELGPVREAVIITEAGGRSKGFGFVTYENDADADAAVEQFDGYQFLTRVINVAEAQSKPAANDNFAPHRSAA
mgnify:CR=1 FL=1